MEKIISEEVNECLAELEPCIRRLSHYSLANDKLFQICIQTSLVRAYEFCRLVFGNRSNDIAIFLFSSLRASCEEVISLSFLQKILDESDRNTALKLFHEHEFHDQLETQSIYFKSNRPFQPVVSSGIDQRSDYRVNLQKLISQAGLNNFKSTKNKPLPSTKVMAETIGNKTLLSLYSFIFSLTSKSVHFSPHGLLKMAWGNLPDFTISTSHFDIYHRAQCQVYGVFLLVVGFEQFYSLLNLSNAEGEAVSKLRKGLRRHPRWPELITHEEMNLSHPNEKILPFLPAAFAKIHMDETGDEWFSDH